MTIVFALLLAGSLVYTLLAILAALRYLSVRTAPLSEAPALSILKPLAGPDPDIEANLRSFFRQDYPKFEMLFAVEHDAAPIVSIVRRLQAEFPTVPSRLLFTGDAPYPNPKTFKLARLVEAASHDILVMSDSDIRVTPSFLSTLAAEFQNPAVGMVTCPYRAVPGRSFWNLLHALMMNTEFLAGCLTARMLEGMKFALGPTIAARKAVLAGIGGLESIKDYCAEDFVMGNLATARGHTVVFSSYVIDHYIGAQSFRGDYRNRIRWVRSTRRSRPAGYIGQFFTYPVPIALLLFIVSPVLWPLVLTLVLRYTLALLTGWTILRDPLTLRYFFLIPVQDLLSFAYWLAGFFGNTIAWHGHTFYLTPDGKYQRLTR